ncbi:MAG: hypothetical protein D6799_05015 [Bacteroidetes bacterium]|nr:MAG: hypothetical protein D6799_05015 [Bacteroidota bacterium]
MTILSEYFQEKLLFHSFKFITMDRRMPMREREYRTFLKLNISARSAITDVINITNNAIIICYFNVS